MTSKFIFSRSDTKNMAAILVSHGALDALCEKNKLLFRWLLARRSILVGSPDNLRSSFTNPLLFCFRPRVYPRPSIPSNSPLASQLGGLFRRYVTLGASTFRALKNIVDETRSLDFLAGEFHPGIALNAEGFVGLYKWLDHVAILAKRKTRILHKCRGLSRVFQRQVEF
jgi:hypothetical protein